MVKPYEYSYLLDYMKAIRNSMWFIDEFKESLIRDISDYNFKLNDVERSIVNRCLLAISQIEVSVKTFWAKVGDNLPKPEIYMVGYSFAESEVRHMEAYSEILTLLKLEDRFKKVLENPIIGGRVDYLTKYLKGASENTKENYALNLLLFSSFIESCSLFSQFLIVKSFCKHRNQLKTIDNIIMATQKEEDIHFQFGIELIKIIKKEYPEWFNDDFYNKIYRACKKAYEAELNIINWIFEKGELDFITKDEVIEFIKERFNKSLRALDLKNVFEVDKELLKKTNWFNEEMLVDVRPDFFDIQSVNYTVGNQDISADSLFL